MSKEIKISKHTLVNGLTLLMIPTRQAPVVSLQGWIRFGAADETDDIAGVAHLFEHLLFKGTEKRKVGVIAAEIEGLGGDLNAYTTYDHTVMHMTLPSQHCDLGLDILADSLLNSTVEADELANERPVILEEIKRRNDMPGATASDLLRQKLFEGHSYSRPVIGYDHVVAGISREKILELYKLNYRADNMFVVIAGDFDEAHVLKVCADLFRNLKGGAQRLARRALSPKNHQSLNIAPHPTSPDTLLQIGWLGPEASHTDVPALDAFALILGQGDSSRLMRKIVHQESLVRDIGASLWAPLNAGSFVIGIKDAAGISKKFTKLFEHIHNEMFRPITEKELEKAKRVLLSQAIYSKETVDGLAERFGYYECLLKDHSQDAAYLERVSHLSVSDLERARDQWLRWDSLTVGGIVPLNDKIPTLAQIPQKGSSASELPSSASKVQKKSPHGITKIKIGDLTLIHRPLTHLPMFCLRWVGLGGSRIEDPKKTGLGQMWARTVTQSATGLDGKSWSREKINELFDHSSAGLSSFHGRNSWGYQLDGLSQDFEKLFEVMLATLLKPTFNEKVFRLEKSHHLLDIESAKDKPGSRVNEIYTRALFGNHPMGRMGLGDKKTVSKFTTRDLIKYHQLQLKNPQVLCVTGDLELDRLVHALEGLAPHFKFKKSNTLLKPKPPVNPRKEVFLREKLKKEQTHILLGVPSCHMKHKDRWAFTALSAILSGQGGRLFIELRDKMSLCYTVAPTTHTSLDGGSFGFYIATSPDKEQTALEGLLREVRRLRDEGLPESEWTKAKNFYLGNHLIDQQRFSSQATGLALDELYGNGFEEYFTFAEHFSKVKASDIVRIMKTYFSEAALKKRVTAVVGPQ